MLGILALILLAFWAIGLATHFLGGIIHIALVIAVILGIAHFLTGRRAMQ